ncbi:MAG: MFS transporter [Lachnospiraceae bacterium]|nr:MFS transporter [Lachnospiraceae bacterium]
MAIGFFLFSTSGSFPVCVAASAIVGLSYGIAGVTAGALMINSWFDKNVGLALGISSAGSGMTSIIWPILIVPVIEGVSLGGAFIVQAVFIAVCALLTFFMVANRPGITDKLLANRVDTSIKAAGDRKGLLVVPRKVTVLFFIAIFMLGMVIFGITGFMSIVYSENFGGAVLGRLVSAYGIALMVFKIAFGRLADKFGAEKAGFVMYIPLIVGLIGAPLAKNEIVAYITALLIGMGSPISAVGAAIYAKDLALPGIYGKVLTYLNITQVGAGLVLSLISGFIADALGSYMYVYFILAGAAVVMAVFIEITYIVRRKCLAAQQQ